MDRDTYTMDDVGRWSKEDEEKDEEEEEDYRPHCSSLQQHQHQLLRRRLCAWMGHRVSSHLTVAMKRTSGHCPAAAAADDDDDNDDSIKPIDGTTLAAPALTPAPAVAP